MGSLAKRALFVASKPRGQSQLFNGVSLLTPFSYSTVYEDQGRIEEERGRGGRYNDNLEDARGVAGFAAEAVVAPVKVAESLGEMARDTVDQAWDSTKKASRDVQDTVVATADQNAVDTAEYRTIIDVKNSEDQADGDYREEGSEIIPFSLADPK